MAHLTLLSLVAWGAVVCIARASVTLTVSPPGPNQIAADTLNIGVNVASTYEITNVQATLGPLTTNLIYLSFWAGVMDTSPLQRGQYTLVVVAQDAFGNSGQAQVLVRIDRPPTLQVSTPFNGTVATSTLQVEATAIDDDPVGARIDVYNGFDQLLCSGSNTVHCVVPGFNGVLKVVATDSANQQTRVQRTVYFEPSTNLVQSISTPGPLLDFSPTRWLYASIPDPPQPAVGELLDLANGQLISAPAIPSWMPVVGWLSSSAAVLVYSNGPSSQGGYVLALQGTNFSTVFFDNLSELQVMDGIAINKYTLYDFNNTTNGCPVYLGTQQFGVQYSLGPAAEIVYVDTNGIIESTPQSPTNVCSRISTRISSLSGNGVLHPITDGVNVVFRNGTNIMATVNGHDEVLASWPVALLDYLQYAAQGGWIAFVKVGASGQRQIWTRSPAGSYEQRTFFNSWSSLESLNGDGALTVQRPEGRFLSMPGVQPIWINSGQGRVKWQGGTPYIVIGNSAFRVVLGALQIEPIDVYTIRLSVSSPPGTRYLIQESADLVRWSDLMTITNNSGVFSITNRLTDSEFYRAILSP